MNPASTRSSPTRRGDPNLAVVLTWLIPGAGHLYLGRLSQGLLVFLGLEGLYWLGVHLSGGMFLQYLPPEMRSRFAPALAPEVGNLGALVLHYRAFGYGDGTPQAWPSTMDWGTLCTSASGVLNLFAMASAHFSARVTTPPAVHLRPAALALCNWLTPGLGYFLQGRRVRALLAAGGLIGLFLLGTALAQGSNLDRERHFYYWSGQFMLGLPAVIAEFLHGHPPVRAEIPYADGGVVIACLAGMLNVLCLLDVYGWSEERVLAEAPAVPQEGGVPAG